MLVLFIIGGLEWRGGGVLLGARSEIIFLLFLWRCVVSQKSRWRFGENVVFGYLWWSTIKKRFTVTKVFTTGFIQHLEPDPRHSLDPWQPFLASSKERLKAKNPHKVKEKKLKLKPKNQLSGKIWQKRWSKLGFVPKINQWILNIFPENSTNIEPESGPKKACP